MLSYLFVVGKFIKVLPSFPLLVIPSTNMNTDDRLACLLGFIGLSRFTYLSGFICPLGVICHLGFSCLSRFIGLSKIGGGSGRANTSRMKEAFSFWRAWKLGAFHEYMIRSGIPGILMFIFLTPMVLRRQERWFTTLDRRGGATHIKSYWSKEGKRWRYPRRPKITTRWPVFFAWAI